MQQGKIAWKMHINLGEFILIGSKCKHFRHDKLRVCAAAKQKWRSSVYKKDRSKRYRVWKHVWEMMRTAAKNLACKKEHRAMQALTVYGSLKNEESGKMFPKKAHKMQIYRKLCSNFLFCFSAFLCLFTHSLELFWLCVPFRVIYIYLRLYFHIFFFVSAFVIPVHESYLRCSLQLRRKSGFNRSANKIMIFFGERNDLCAICWETKQYKYANIES